MVVALLGVLKSGAAYLRWIRSIGSAAAADAGGLGARVVTQRELAKECRRWSAVVWWMRWEAGREEKWKQGQ